MSEYEPGVGARTLTPEAGMLFSGRSKDRSFRIHDR